jgi:ParB/RepB/Spo0J family partition protein
MEIQNIPLVDILIDDNFNCRGDSLTHFDVTDLAKAIEKEGLINPVTLTLLPPNHSSGKKYKLIAGFRRTKAHEVLKRTEIFANVREDLALSDKDALIFNLSENVNRKSLNIKQEANALTKLRGLGLTRPQLEDAVGQSWGWIQVRFFLMDLPEEIQDEILAFNLGQSDIRHLRTIWKQDPENLKPVYGLLRRMKDAKQMGRKVKPKSRKKATVKAVRTRGDINEVIDYLVENYGTHPMARSLAWAAGNITTIDLLGSIREYCDDHGIDFVPAPELLEEVRVGAAYEIV